MKLVWTMRLDNTKRNQSTLACHLYHTLNVSTNQMDKRYTRSLSVVLSNNTNATGSLQDKPESRMCQWLYVAYNNLTKDGCISVHKI